jgi:tripartite-type tricarboxylate transporter receptor subunit TctC
LPRDIVMRWNQEVNRLLELSEFRERLAGDSMEPVGGPPERFLEILRSDVAKWKKVVQVSAIKVGP